MKQWTRLGLLLALTAGLGAAPAAAQAKPASGTAPAASPAQITQGDSIFHGAGNCYACHGANAQGAIGPNLTDAEWIHLKTGSADEIAALVTTGVPKEQSKSGIVMPPKGGGALTDEQVKAVAAYVHSLSQKKS